MPEKLSDGPHVVLTATSVDGINVGDVMGVHAELHALEGREAPWTLHPIEYSGKMKVVEIENPGDGLHRIGLNFTDEELVHEEPPNNQEDGEDEE